MVPILNIKVEGKQENCKNFCASSPITDIRGGIGNKLDYWNKKITVKARKVLIIQLFFVYPMSVRIHFSQHSNYCLMAVANSLAAMIVVTPTKVSVGCLCPGRGPQLLLHPPKQKEIPRSKAWWLVECQRCSMLWSANHCLRKGAMATGALSQWKNCSFCRGSKDRSFLERNHFCIFSSSWASLHSWFFSPKLSESAVRQYFKSLICFWSHLVCNKIIKSPSNTHAAVHLNARNCSLLATVVHRNRKCSPSGHKLLSA